MLSMIVDLGHVDHELQAAFLQEPLMLGIPRRFSHYVFGIIQSGLTSLIAAGIASYPFLAAGAFVRHWLQSWVLAWVMMLPIVVFAAPVIRGLTHALTREERP
jgi:hypothetical protein